MTPKKERRHRSNDYPDISEYPIYLLRDVEKFCMEMERMNPVPTNPIRMIMKKFNVPIGNASILYSASRFAIDLKKRGKA